MLTSLAVISVCVSLPLVCLILRYNKNEGICSVPCGDQCLRGCANTCRKRCDKFVNVYTKDPTVNVYRVERMRQPKKSTMACCIRYGCRNSCANPPPCVTSPPCMPPPCNKCSKPRGGCNLIPCGPPPKCGQLSMSCCLSPYNQHNMKRKKKESFFSGLRARYKKRNNQIMGDSACGCGGHRIRTSTSYKCGKKAARPYRAKCRNPKKCVDPCPRIPCKTAPCCT